ncbi:hypothetical protein [Petralouisia muris]|nr:hypothetical protein [Petralouisia muris]
MQQIYEERHHCQIQDSGSQAAGNKGQPFTKNTGISTAAAETRNFHISFV